MDPITILAGIKTGMAAGKTIAGLSKDIGNFFDATDAAKKQLQKKLHCSRAFTRSEEIQRGLCAATLLVTNTVSDIQICQTASVKLNLAQNCCDTESQ